MGKSAAEQLKYWDEILDEYENKMKLPANNSPGEQDELEKYLTMDRNVIEKFDSDECSIIAYRLSQFSFYVQRMLNQEVARVNWAKATIKSVITPTVNNFKGFSYEERTAAAVHDNEHATALNKIAIYAQQRVDRLTFLAASLKNLADFMKSIHFNKRNTHE